MKKATLDRLLKTFEPRIRKAFRDSIQDWGDNVDMAAFKRALKAQDIQAAVSALNLDDAAFEPLRAAIEGSYAAGGAGGAQEMGKLRQPGGGSAILRFDVRDLDAERQIRNYSSTKVKDISDSSREAIRIALENSFIRGDNPTVIAKDLLGTLNRSAGKREGAVLGLTRKQEQTLLNAANELRTNPAAFLKRKLRNKITDRSIMKAVNADKPVPSDVQAKALARMKDNMIRERAKTIGRTEAMTTLQMGNRASYQQALNKGLITPEDIEREWSSTGDNRERESHRDMDGTKVAWDEAYVLPSGARMMCPHDPQGPAEEVINCRCWEIIRINYLRKFQ